MKKNRLTNDEMKCKIGNHHFYKIYDNNLNYGGQFVEDTRDGDYVEMGNMGLNDEKDVAWYVKRKGVWVPCKRPKKSPLYFLASDMQMFEKELACEVNGATIKAFWEREPDGSGVYIVDYYNGNETSSANITWDGNTFAIYWGFNDAYKEETPKRFVNILNELVTLLNQ